MSSVLARAGGFTDKAYHQRGLFYPGSREKMQADHLKQIIDRIEAEMLATYSTEQAQTALDKDVAAEQKMILAHNSKHLSPK